MGRQLWGIQNTGQHDECGQGVLATDMSSKGAPRAGQEGSGDLFAGGACQVCDCLDQGHDMQESGVLGQHYGWCCPCLAVWFHWPGSNWKGDWIKARTVKQAIVKCLLSEWSRTSLTSYSYPLLLHNPFTVLVKLAAVTLEMLQHVLVLCYYTCLAHTVIGMVFLNKAQSCNSILAMSPSHTDLFRDIQMFSSLSSIAQWTST